MRRDLVDLTQMHVVNPRHPAQSVGALAVVGDRLFHDVFGALKANTDVSVSVLSMEAARLPLDDLESHSATSAEPDDDTAPASALVPRHLLSIMLDDGAGSAGQSQRDESIDGIEKPIVSPSFAASEDVTSRESNGGERDDAIDSGLQRTLGVSSELRPQAQIPSVGVDPVALPVDAKKALSPLSGQRDPDAIAMQREIAGGTELVSGTEIELQRIKSSGVGGLHNDYDAPMHPIQVIRHSSLKILMATPAPQAEDDRASGSTQDNVESRVLAAKTQISHWVPAEPTKVPSTEGVLLELAAEPLLQTLVFDETALHAADRDALLSDVAVRPEGVTSMTSVHMPVPSRPDFLARVASHMLQALVQGADGSLAGQFEIDLGSDTLGKVILQVQVVNSVLHLQLLHGSPDAQLLIRRAAPALLKALETTELSEVTLAIGQESYTFSGQFPQFAQLSARTTKSMPFGRLDRRL